MYQEPTVFKNARIVSAKTQMVVYESGGREEKILTLCFGEEKKTANIIISRIKGKKHITAKFISRQLPLKVEGLPIKHNGEEEIYEASRIIVYKKNGEATIVFT